MRSSKTKKTSVAAEPTVAYLTTKGKKAAAKKLKPLTDADWVRPGRPATDEEIEKMLDECEAEFEAGLGFTLEEARALTKKKIASWKKANRK